MPEEPPRSAEGEATLSPRDDRTVGGWYQQAPVTTHADGFAIFLSPEQIEAAGDFESQASYRSGVRTAFDRWRAEVTLDLVSMGVRPLKTDPRILDLGCGDGFMTAEIENTWPNARVCGLDYSLPSIQAAVRRCRRVEFAVADACAPPYLDGVFDLVVCNNIWEHVPDPLALLRAISRVLRPRGVVVITTPNRYRLTNLLRALFGRRVTFMSQHHVTEYSIGQVEEQLRYGGFEVLKTVHRPMPRVPGFRLRAVLLHYLAKPILHAWLSLIGSHHHLEVTQFVAAQRHTAPGD